MILSSEEKNGYLLATIQLAEASLDKADAFKEEVSSLLDQGHKRIVISFEKVSYIDSSFLGALVASLKYAISKQADISLVSLQKDIYNLMHLIRIDKVFSIYNTIEDASKSSNP